MGTPPSDWCICHGWRWNNSCLRSWQIWPHKRRDGWDPLWFPTKGVTWLPMNYYWFCSGAFSKVNAKRADQVVFAPHPRRATIQVQGFGAGGTSAIIPLAQGSRRGADRAGQQRGLASWCKSLLINMAKRWTETCSSLLSAPLQIVLGQGTGTAQENWTITMSYSLFSMKTGGCIILLLAMQTLYICVR